MKIKAYLKNLGISQKFVYSLFLFLIIPLIILLFVVNYNVKSRLNAKVCDENLETLKQTKTGIENFINDMKFVSLNVAANDEVQTLIKNVNQKKDPEVIRKQYIKANMQIRSILESRGTIRSISIFNEEDVIYQFGDFVMSEDRQFINRLQELGGRVLWTGVHDGITTSYGSYYPRLYLMRAVNDLYSMNRLAYERLTIDESGLSGLYTGITGKGSDIYIVDREENILSATDMKLIGSSFYEVYNKGILSENAGYFQDDKKVYTYYQIEDAGWRIIKVDDADTLFADNGAIYTIILLCIIFTVIFGIFFVFLQRRTIIIPIKKLSYQTQMFKEDNFEIQVYNDSEDEMGQLNRNLAGMVQYIQNLIQTQYKNEIKQREIELKYMQSQINPHFLYNALDAIRWMAVVEQQEQIAVQVEALSDIFRHALNSGREMVTIEQEVSHLESYILIQKNRFGDRIRIQIEVEPELLQCEVIKLILQPLVENAIIHGLEEKIGGGEVTVKIKSQGQDICYFVEDNGLGADQLEINRYIKDPKESHNAFALKNIDERIKIKYGDQYGIHFYSEKGVGTRVETRMPMEILQS